MCVCDKEGEEEVARQRRRRHGTAHVIRACGGRRTWFVIVPALIRPRHRLARHLRRGGSGRRWSGRSTHRRGREFPCVVARRGLGDHKRGGSNGGRVADKNDRDRARHTCHLARVAVLHGQLEVDPVRRHAPLWRVLTRWVPIAEHRAAERAYSQGSAERPSCGVVGGGGASVTVSVGRGMARVWKGARDRQEEREREREREKRAAAVVGAAESSGGEGTCVL